MQTVHCNAICTAASGVREADVSVSLYSKVLKWTKQLHM